MGMFYDLKQLKNAIYMIYNKMEQTINCDERLKYLHNNLRQIKSDNQIGVNYMTVEERIRQIKEEGARRTIIEMVLKKMKRGKSLEVIADEVEETVEFIQPIFDMIQKQGIDSDVQTIYELVYEADEE